MKRSANAIDLKSNLKNRCRHYSESSENRKEVPYNLYFMFLYVIEIIRRLFTSKTSENLILVFGKNNIALPLDSTHHEVSQHLMFHILTDQNLQMQQWLRDSFQEVNVRMHYDSKLLDQLFVMGKAYLLMQLVYMGPTQSFLTKWPKAMGHRWAKYGFGFHIS